VAANPASKQINQVGEPRVAPLRRLRPSVAQWERPPGPAAHQAQAPAPSRLIL